MARYRLEPINNNDDVWAEYSKEPLIISADTEQQARFRAANANARKVLESSIGRSLPLPPWLLSNKTRCVAIDS